MQMKNNDKLAEHHLYCQVWWWMYYGVQKLILKNKQNMRKTENISFRCKCVVHKITKTMK